MHTRLAYKPGVHSERYRPTVYLNAATTVSLDNGLSISVLRWPLEVVDNERRRGDASRFECESELVSHDGKQ